MAAAERALGIDPGSRVTGWGVVERIGQRLHAVECGTIRLGGLLSMAARLERLQVECRALLDAWRPETLVLERAFVARNVQSAFRLGETRGVVLATAAAVRVAVAEYAPAHVKVAATGYGQAAKDAVARGVMMRLGLTDEPSSDAADALALAICHLERSPVALAIASAERRRVRR